MNKLLNNLLFMYVQKRLFSVFNTIRFIILCAYFFCILFQSCAPTQKNQYQLTKNYQPDDQQLYNTIVQLDSLFFDAYNNCSTKLDYYAGFYADSTEFYHDQGGLMTSKKQMVDATEKNICGKVTRELIKGSIEVYPIKGYGAVEIGLHKFINNQEPVGTKFRVGRFMIIWHQENNQWKIKRVVSLH